MLALAIQFKVQAHDVSLLSDDLGCSAAVKGEGYVAVFQHPARIAPHHRECAEAISSSRNVYPRRATQLMPVWQADRSAARDVPVHAVAPSLNPACCFIQPPGSEPVHTPGGGYLARAFSTRAGHFSFSQPLKHLDAYFTNPTKSAGGLPAADRAGAATIRLAPAKSRPFPKIKINHVHAVLLSEVKVAAHRSALAELSSVRADK